MARKRHTPEQIIRNLIAMACQEHDPIGWTMPSGLIAGIASRMLISMACGITEGS